MQALEKEFEEECPFLDRQPSIMALDGVEFRRQASSHFTDKSTGDGEDDGSCEQEIDLEKGQSLGAGGNPTRPSSLMLRSASSGGLKPSKSTETFLEPIREGIPSAPETVFAAVDVVKNEDEEDQLCLTGAAGAALKAQLSKALSSSTTTLAGPNTASGLIKGIGASALFAAFSEDLYAGTSSSHQENELYYTSVPAAVGRQMQAELQRQCSIAQILPHIHEDTQHTHLAARAEAEEGHVEYYSTVPATAGRDLQQELQAQLQQQKQQQKAKQNEEIEVVSSSISAASVNAVPALPALKGIKTAAAVKSTGSGTASESPSPAGGSLSVRFGGVDSVQSMPAAVGRAMQVNFQFTILI